MKVLVLYVMITCLKIINLNILEKLANVGKNNEEILKQVEENKVMKEFIQRVMNSNGYKTKIQQIGRLRDGISKKKHLVKQKSKERKAKKLEKRKQIKSNNQSVNGQLDQIQQDESEQNSLEQQSEKIEKRNAKIHSSGNNYQSVIETSKENPKLDERQKNSFWNRTKLNNNHIKQDNFQMRNQDINSNRTEFIKKGRNKVIQQKKDRRQKYHKGKQSGFKTQALKPKQKPTQHPSWIAKQEEKKLACISQFQGKKILL